MTTYDLGFAWYDSALCLQVGADFFPRKGDSKAAHQARKVCGLCSVRAECLADALKLNDQYGIKGGTSPRQRAKMRRESRPESRKQP